MKYSSFICYLSIGGEEKQNSNAFRIKNPYKGVGVFARTEVRVKVGESMILRSVVRLGFSVSFSFSGWKCRRKCKKERLEDKVGDKSSERGGQLFPSAQSELTNQPLE